MYEITEKEKLAMTQMAEKMDTSQMMNLRGEITIIKDNYRTHTFRSDPTNSTIFENSNVAKMDIVSTQKSVQGVNYITKRMSEEGRKEAKNILEKFAQNHYGDRLIRDTQGLNPIKSINDYRDFEKAKPAGIALAEQIAQNEEQKERLDAKAGTTTPDPANKPIYDLENGYLGNFKDGEAALQLLKSCIPCEFRKLNFTAEFGRPWAQTLIDLNKKWKDLLKQLKALATFQPGEFSTDLCNLFKFLDGQCIPDIAGLMSLLSIMQLKYTDLSLSGLRNIINQLVAPFLTPLIGSFSSNLDQYADLIIGPLKCITAALEKQMINLQDQVNAVKNMDNVNTVNFHKKEVDFLDAKIKALNNRLIQIDINKATRVAKSAGLGQVNDLNRDSIQELPAPAFKNGRTADLTREERVINTRLVKGGIRLLGEKEIGTEPNDSYQLTIAQEVLNIKREIKKLEGERGTKYSIIREEAAGYSPTNWNKGVGFTRETTFALDNMERAYTSTIRDLTNVINDGVGIIKQSIDIYRDEFQRLLLGRVTTQQDQIEFTRTLQKIARLLSIVAAVDQFQKAGMNLKKYCERGSGAALTQVAKGLKANSNGGMYDFYQAQDAEGNPLIVITPGGAQVNVTSIDFDAIGNDALFGDSSVTLESVTKTVSFNDLNEVDKMNREGIVPDLGNIDSKKIQLNITTRPGSDLDLHFKTSYAIISNEFCSKSAIDFGSSDTVKKWANSLWQKN